MPDDLAPHKVAVSEPSESDGHEFIINRNALAGSAPQPTNVAHVAAVAVGCVSSGRAEPAEIRGVCPGCGRDVMSNDEGRQREGETYYHGDCVKL